MLIGVMIITEVIMHCIEKSWKDLGLAIAVIALSLGIIAGTRISWLNMNQTYLKETMRGGHSELKQ
jgi:hypothetical protein